MNNGGVKSGTNVVRLQGPYGNNNVSAALHSQGYSLGRTIGEGSYSKVKIAYKSYKTGAFRKIACKVINKRKASTEFVEKFLPREICILLMIQHPNIVTIFDIIDASDQVFVFMDLCEGSDLLNHIKARGDPLVEGQARKMFQQLVSAIEYLHEMNISHRDIKCENVLIAGKGIVKITDFGFSRLCHNEAGHRVLSETFCGSAAYAAPEVLQGIPYNPKLFDMWSLGCVLYVMLTANMPFDDTVIKDMLKFQMARRLTFPVKCKNSISLAARRLIYHLLEPDVTRRATVSQVMGCSWFRDMRCPHVANPQVSSSVSTKVK